VFGLAALVGLVVCAARFKKKDKARHAELQVALRARDLARQEHPRRLQERPKPSRLSALRDTAFGRTAARLVKWTGSFKEKSRMTIGSRRDFSPVAGIQAHLDKKKKAPRFEVDEVAVGSLEPDDGPGGAPAQAAPVMGPRKHSSYV